MILCYVCFVLSDIVITPMEQRYVDLCFSLFCYICTACHSFPLFLLVSVVGNAEGGVGLDVFLLLIDV